tara:strand:- start:679 stop:870 length:192 start_codon:yes stop_codon:yes gene_type:complete
MICLDKQFDKIDSSALSILTDVMRQYALEIGQDMKNNAEIGMRSEPNLIDALNTSYDYGYTKE